jgi:hypothetical protein
VLTAEMLKSYKEWLAFLALYTAYLLFGAYVLMAIESPLEDVRIRNMETARRLIYGQSANGKQFQNFQFFDFFKLKIFQIFDFFKLKIFQIFGFFKFLNFLNF